MGHGQRRSHWHTHKQQRNVSRRCDGEHQWQHQHEAHFIEQRETDGKTGQHHRPLNVLLTKFVDKRGGNTLRAATVCQHFAEHGTEAHDQRQAAERAADTGFNGADNFNQRHTLHQTDCKCHQNQSDKSVHFETDHQEQ
ncbi:Uncharacterised protein [Enterobacter kobei]|nr:Uncharacterised protein [Enterobacter kobei]